MNKIFQFSMGALMAGALLNACSPDSFDGADPNGIPSVENVDFNISVDQETNQMIATYTPQPGTYPVWIVNGNSYSTLQEVGYQNPEAGTYTIDLKLGNRNGFSHGVVSKSFTFNETKIDYTADFRRLCDKEWRIANKEVGHLGCGPAGTAATDWWSAAPNDKKDFGIYDDRITFTTTNRKGGGYTYNPGADGKTFVNKGVTKWNTQNDADDVDVTIGSQTSTWSFEVYDWEDAAGNVTKQTYIQFAANTMFPYISSDAQYENPMFRIESLTASKLVLVYETPDRTIAWRFVLTSAADERLVEEQGFDASSDFNLWKGVTPTASFYFNPGWVTDLTEEMKATYVEGANDYTITVPEACSDRWQAQFQLHSDVNITADKNYDFSVILNADKDVDGVTVKVTDEADGETIIDVADVSLKAGQDVVFWKSDLKGKTLNQVKVVFDFGYAPKETKININSIVLKDHANDDGTIVKGGESGDQPVMDWDPAAASNLWAAVEAGTAFKSTSTFFANEGWSALETQPEIIHKDGAWEFVAPAGVGPNQWQGQVKIMTTLPASKAKKYNFYCVVESDVDISGVTIKLTQSDESEDKKHDDNHFFDGRHDVKADVPLIYKAEAVELKKDDAHELTLVYDFGGIQEGAHVKISKIFLEEAVVMAYDDANNLWKSVDDGTNFKGTSTYFADAGWSMVETQPEIKHDGSKWSLTVPEGVGSNQWQAQVKILTTLSAKQNDPYNFQCTITADSDINDATIKLTQSDESEEVKHDDNKYFDGRHNLKADEPFVYKATGVTLPKGDAHEFTLVFDFAGAPAGTNITISDIIFEKAQ
ncbi:hypothetical protein L6472_02090 [Prevotella sp. E13-17]|uniref:hypothetical protein n=1 Tax=Prevotella sp. E13-17 TaxID=2913616 RepID=UPI001EDA2186|nr:hypothetical protein [Prevotella sp. E13-17]UKK51405.1 hypothetical protein L6472_02090 [Prevotella sp. E13-17]